MLTRISRPASVWRALIVPICVFLCAYTIATSAFASTLTISPSSATFVVGSTFDVPIYVDSEQQAINAIALLAKFPPDKLQMIAPSTGQSIITLWTQQPSYDNRNGTVSIQGVIPNGITTGNGLVTTMTFRVRAPGDAYVKFLDGTKVLLHDGLGTDVLRETHGAVFHLLLPPPAGPIIASETHPDPYTIYRTNDVFLTWTPEDPDVSRYSYVLNDTPVDFPDDISLGSSTEMVYRDLPDGRHFFHLKGYRIDTWGGTSHFSISIDTTKPAEFPVNLLPESRILPGKQVVVEFASTDAFSGIDHYELNVIPRSGVTITDGSGEAEGEQPMFIEATSPYVLPGFSESGKYDIIVRAFDKAGNMRESMTTLTVVTPLFGLFTEDGIQVFRGLFVPWWLVIVLLCLLLLFLLVILYEIRARHKRAHERLMTSQLPDALVNHATRLEEKKKEYLQITQLVVLSVVALGSLVYAPRIHAATIMLDPPMITSVARNIGNDEIFYAGGITGVPDATITVYIQNTQTGETLSGGATVDERGSWFYRQNGFLHSGEYILWAQQQIGNEKSPPSPQEQLVIHRTALQIGSSRLSYEFVFGTMVIVLLIGIAGLLFLIAYHRRHARIKEARWRKEVNEAEQAIRTGFAVLKRDIEAELAIVRKAKLTKTIHAEEIGKEDQLLRDLEWVESNITKEVVDIEKEL